MGRKLRRISAGIMMLAVCVIFMLSYNIDNAEAVATSYYNGLLGQYFDTAEPSNLSYERLIRVDQFEGFNWMTDAPDNSIESDTFSVVWTGYIEVPSTGNYDFYTYSDDGVQLKINGEELINRWGLVNLEYTKSNHTMYLEQGVKYQLSLKYQEIPLNATIFLFWKKEGELKSMVPSTAFYVCQNHYDKYQSQVRVNCLQANGEGLQGEYFNGAQTVVDENSVHDYISPDGQMVNFDWGIGSPDNSITTDDFSARWTGYLEAKYSEPVTLQLVSDDGVRMWIDDELVLDKWQANSQVLHEATINMKCGKFYKIRLEYNELSGGASCILYWKSAGQEKEIIPRQYLYSDQPTLTPAGPDPDPGPCSGSTNTYTTIGITASDDSVGLTGIGNRAIDSSNSYWQIQLNNATLKDIVSTGDVQLTGLPVGLNYGVTKINGNTLQITVNGTAGANISSEQTVQLKVLASAVTSGYFIDSTAVSVKLVPLPEPNAEFIEYLRDENIYVYGNNAWISGSARIIGDDATVVVKGNFTPGLGDVHYLMTKNIYIQRNVILGGSAGLGNPDGSSSIYVNGDVTVLGSLSTANVPGRIHGSLYYTGNLIVSPWITLAAEREKVDSIDFPEFEIPDLRTANWYSAKGYTSNATAATNMKYYGNSIAFPAYGTYTNVTIASTANIILPNNVRVKGVLFAPNGTVTISGSSTFSGIIIARDLIINGDAVVNFKPISDVSELPF